MKTIEVIDSHTGGEPTRIIVGGGPDLGIGSLKDRMAIFQKDFDHIRSAVVNEPRGSDVLVGGLLCEPFESDCSAGVIFFNNVGFLGMCGHGTIGLMTTLKHMAKLTGASHLIDTPVGKVKAEYLDDGRVRVLNVPSYRHQANVKVDVNGIGQVIGDVSWGGNWFFLVKEGVEETLDVSNSSRLTEITMAIRDALSQQGIGGENGAYIDHVELFSSPFSPENHSRNFVLCPGAAYDRSPCGTGTSAKLACLAADDKLQVGENWNQESIIGSVFSCSYEKAETEGHILPSIIGSAFVTGTSKLILNPKDPFCMGIS